MLKVAILVLSLGCAYASNGEVRTVALGQATAQVCEGEECVEAKGGPLSDGIVGVLLDLFRLPFKAVAGAAGAVASP